VDSLIERGIINKLGDGLKVLARARLRAALQSSAHSPKAAAEKIAKAGGEAKVIGAAASLIGSAACLSE